MTVAVERIDRGGDNTVGSSVEFDMADLAEGGSVEIYFIWLCVSPGCEYNRHQQLPNGNLKSAIT